MGGGSKKRDNKRGLSHKLKSCGGVSAARSAARSAEVLRLCRGSWGVGLII